MNAPPASLRTGETNATGRGTGLFRKTVPDLAAALVLVALVPVLFGGVLGHDFIEDDLPLIAYARAHAPAEYFLKPEAIRQLPWRVLAPLQILSFDLDQHRFGLSPRGYYAHHLAALALAALALFALARRWLGPGLAFAGTLLFLLGPPVATVANELMDRHYLEGLALAAAAAGLWVAGLRSRRPALAWAAAFLYLGAAAAKEIYVPLPLLLAALPEGEVRRRLRHLAPLGAVLAGYLLWRFWMLGGLVSAYGFGLSAGDLPALLLRFPGALGEGARQAPWAATLVAFSAVGAAFLAFRSRRVGLFLAVTMLVLAAPLLPVAKTLRPRYLMLPWLAVALVAAFLLREMDRRLGRRSGWTAALAGGLLALGAAAYHDAWGAAAARGERLSAETRFAATAEGKDLLSHPLAELSPLAAEAAMLPAARQAPPPAWYYDDLYLCSRPLDGLRIWSWSERERRLVDRTREMPAFRERFCRSIRWRAPLAVELRYRRGVLRWKLGPAGQGEYSLLLGDGAAAYPVAPRERMRIGPPRGALRVRYRSPQGWVTYSDALDVDFARRADVEWRRQETAPVRNPDGPGRSGLVRPQNGTHNR